MLQDLSTFLGEKEGLDEKGETVWNGMVREFLDGRTAVRATIALLDDETNRLQDSCNRADGMYIVIKDKGEPLSLDFDALQLKEWADEAFKGCGGSRKLFAQLKDKKGQYQVISQLSGFAADRISKNREAELSFVNSFKKLTKNEQKEALKKLLSRAMPWLDIDIKGHFSSTFSSSQYKCLIAVNEKDKFQELFDPLMGDVVPDGNLIPKLYESSVKGRLVCYIELSGFPLDIIKPLRTEWKSEYARIIRDGKPLHNHKDWTRFPDPLVPTKEEAEIIITNMQLFLEGIAFGALRRKKGAEGYYEVQIEPGRWQGVGNERRILAMGFDTSHKEAIEQHLREIKEKIVSPYQMLAMKVLFNQIAENTYAPIEELDATGFGKNLKGLGSIQSGILAKVWEERLKHCPTQFENQSTLEKQLIDELKKWTVEVQDSKYDLDQAEVDIKKATPKCTVKPDFFKEGWLEGFILNKQPAENGGSVQGVTVMKCPDCGTVVQPGFKLCPNCGRKLGGCPNCGHAIQPGFKVCPNCGGNLQVARQEACPKCAGRVEAGWKICPFCTAQLGA